ncbi:MAG: PepSY-associated TM helix domain-containing protein [Bacteroidota bacterium]
MFKKYISQLHLWLGLGSGIIVFILGVTGCIWAFEEEIKHWVYADKLFIEAPEQSTQHTTLSKSLEAAQEALNPGYDVQRMTIYNDPGRSQLFRHYTPDTTTSSIWYWDEAASSQEMHVNPYTASVIAQEDPTFEFFRFVVMLHWSLLLINDIGQPIVGISTIIFVIMLITGLVLWLPKNKRHAKKNLSFQWKKSFGWKHKNYDLHNMLGFYASTLVVFIALTELMWAFDWFESSVQWIANSGKTIEKKK